MHDHHQHFIQTSLGFWTFFTMGLLGSLHCVGMCGPLSSLFIGTQHWKSYFGKITLYHLSRLVGYSVTGLIMSSVGFQLSIYIPPFVLLLLVILPLTAYAFNVSLPFPKQLTFIFRKIVAKTQQGPAFLKPVLVGFLTPLLPCGLLYTALLLSLQASSLYQGGLWMLAFGLGTLALLFLSQIGFQTLLMRINPSRVQFFLRGCALFSALLILAFYLYHH